MKSAPLRTPYPELLAALDDLVDALMVPRREVRGGRMVVFDVYANLSLLSTRPQVRWQGLSCAIDASFHAAGIIDG